MSSSSDLARAMKTALSDSGDLIEVRAQLEEDVLEAARECGKLQEPRRPASRQCKPAMPPEIILANNLIRQYLVSVGLQKTSSVLVTESGLPHQGATEAIQKSTFPSSYCSSDRPLLSSMILNLLKSDKQSLLGERDLGGGGN